MPLIVFDAFWVVFFTFFHVCVSALLPFFNRYRPFLLGVLFWAFFLWFFGSEALFSGWQLGLLEVVDQGEAQ
jgi:hypothetical protein